VKSLYKRIQVTVLATLALLLVVGGSVAYAAPGGYRLPFSGYAEISAGPRCNQHYGQDQEAIDFVMQPGRQILASKSGVAYFYPNTWPGGNMVKIYHSDGLHSTYAHLSSFEATKYWYYTHYYTNGLWVNQGEVIGYAGSTGNSTGTHLHFSVNRSNNSAVVIYDLPGIRWWISNVANRWSCTIDGRNEGSGSG